MIIPLDKLIMFSGNKYVFTKASMLTIEKLGNISEYPDVTLENWKVVPNILKLMLEQKVNYSMDTSDTEVI